MNQPNSRQIDERLRGVLVSAMQRDPDVLRNADHLQALLSDLAPDMPSDLRNACVAVARTNATNWLTQTPAYTEDQVVAWLRAQYPDMKADVAGQAVAAFAVLTGARTGAPAPAVPAAAPAAPPTPAPVFDQPTVAGSVGQLAAPPISNPPVQAPPPTSNPAVRVPPPTSNPPVGNMQTAMVGYPQEPPQYHQQYQHPSWPPPPPPAQKSRKTPIILAVVAVLLIAGGVGAWFAFKGSDKKALAAPAGVTTQLDGFGSVAVSWHAVPEADHYVVSDLTGALPNKQVTGTSVTFQDAATKNHRFVVQAFRSDGSGGAKSTPATWTGRKPLTAPTDLTAVQSGFDLNVSWSAVDGASGYQLRDQDDPSFTPDTITGTSYKVSDAIYTTHHFVVAAVVGSATGPSSDAASFSPEHELSADEAVLAYKLPASLAEPGSCQADTSDEESTYVSAAVSCTPASPIGADGPQSLFASQLTGSQNAYEQDQFGKMQLKAGCESYYPESGTHATWSIDGKTMGDEYCFENGGHNVFAWTYYKENISIQIEGTAPTTRTGLHDWWMSSSHSATLR